MTVRYAWTISVPIIAVPAFEENYKRSSAIVQAQPGAEGAELIALPDKQPGLPRTKHYQAIGSWATREDRWRAVDAARATPGWHDNSEYGTVTELGWLDEVARVAPPKPGWSCPRCGGTSYKLTSRQLDGSEPFWWVRDCRSCRAMDDCGDAGPSDHG